MNNLSLSLNQSSSNNLQQNLFNKQVNSLLDGDTLEIYKGHL